MLIPSNYAQANFRFTGPPVPTGGEVTLGLNVELYGGSPADAAADLRSAFVLNVLPLLTNDLVLSEIEVKFGPNATGPSGTAVSGANGAGGTSSSPPNTSWLIDKETGFGGRQGKGRMYLPGLGDADIFDGGTINPTEVANMQTAMDAFYTAIVGDALIPTLLRAADSPIQTPVPITAFSVQGRAATQRRRLRR